MLLRDGKDKITFGEPVHSISILLKISITPVQMTVVNDSTFQSKRIAAINLLQVQDY